MIDTRAALGILVLSTLTACSGSDVTVEDGGEGGGGASATGAGGGGASATTGTTSTSTTTAATTTTGAGGACGGPEDCADPGSCMVPTCDEGTCGAAAAALDTTCDLAGELDGVCNAAGTCVACNRNEQCGPGGDCDGGTCVPSCGNGLVDGDETDVDCGGSCEANCAVGQACSVGTDCESNVCDADGVCLDGTVAFVTADPVLPDFGGALAADALCQELAEEAGLSGTFMAWVSDSTTSPEARFTPSSAPYRRIDGLVVADGWDDLTSGAILAGIDIDQNGEERLVDEVWTGTASDASPFDATCLDWTSTAEEDLGWVGVTSDGSSGWTSAYLQFCNRMNVRLYCFQQ